MKLFSAAAGLALALGAAPASAAVYTDSFTADPTTFTCHDFGTTRLCGGSQLLNTPRFLNTNDIVNETITFTHPLVVPGSQTRNFAYVTLFDPLVVNAPATPGPDNAQGIMVMSGYNGPTFPIVNTTGSFAHEYIAVEGFCCGYKVPNAGFSGTGASVSFDVLNGDPLPNIGVAYGYTLVLTPEPATLAFVGAGLAGLAMSRRKRKA